MEPVFYEGGKAESKQVANVLEMIIAMKKNKAGYGGRKV
jgi:hypothetical protein